jgi:predicted dehydrogenase
VLFRFANGAIGTATISDAVAAPWSWELTSGENPAYPRQDADCYFFAGTKGSIAFPSLTTYRYRGSAGWTAPLTSHRSSARQEINPLVEQLGHFCDVIEGTAVPAVSADEAIRTLAVIEAIKTSAQTQAWTRPAIF